MPIIYSSHSAHSQSSLPWPLVDWLVLEGIWLHNVPASCRAKTKFSWDLCGDLLVCILSFHMFGLELAHCCNSSHSCFYSLVTRIRVDFLNLWCQQDAKNVFTWKIFFLCNILQWQNEVLENHFYSGQLL